MEKTKLLFGIHCHQPYNNFFEVIEKATEKSYYPFLKILSEYPNIKISIHYSGWLLEWIKIHRKALFNLIKKLVDNGQVEIFTSGYYEPILASIPEEDAYLQIRKSNKFLKENFGIVPEGLWLTERVWDSKIVKLLVESGIKYVTVDDYHFISAGFNKDKLQGYYLTEEEDSKLGIFPISKDLRYAIPFKEVDEVLNFLKEFKTAIIFDDGEKFGWWPHTYEWVFERNWLNTFFEKLSANDEIETCFFRDFFQNNHPLGRVYLPIASYFEMGEWSLDYESSKQFQDYYKKLTEEFKIDENVLQKFFKGGIWKNFLVKYEESNNIHKKMLKVSNLLENKALEDEATDFLLKSQCNDCLWHGVFGGIYLPNLRDNAYISLNRAEKFIKKYEKKYYDFNCDGYNELELRNDKLIAVISGKNGAQLFELSDLETGFNILNTLTRRKEVYHDEILNSEVVDEDNDDEVKTIHEIRYRVTNEIKKALHFDSYLKYAFIDLFFPKNPIEDIGNIREEYYFAEKTGIFYKIGNLRILNEKFNVKIEKKYLLDNSTLKVNYSLKNLSPAHFNLNHAVEINLYFPGAIKEGSFIDINGTTYNFLKEFQVENIFKIKIFDEIMNRTVELRCSENFKLKCSPIFTVSKSEKEYEKTYQGTTFLLNFPFELKFNEEKKFKIEIELK